jgi:hypothetical protein
MRRLAFVKASGEGRCGRREARPVEGVLLWRWVEKRRDSPEGLRAVSGIDQNVPCGLHNGVPVEAGHVVRIAVERDAVFQIKQRGVMMAVVEFDRATAIDRQVLSALLLWGILIWAIIPAT